ncbi:epoxide hydrolase family protein [Arthrobacter sp. NtRootA1]|uniref:epoxide hydrolase family protein n=1 Tax=Micrococcaceae TaxID=1268 RepID=UPI001CC6BE2A|nr:epoxide hydrolase family protein [Arthrobacter sp. NtRootA1]BCW05888.1 microsomal epoxide hydrolase [Arthrobacter sp. NtRootA1]
MMEFRPFSVDVSDEVLADLDRRLAGTRWPDAIPGSGWTYGADLGYLRELVTYWKDHFDWRAFEKRFNAFPQFTTIIDGQHVHFLHVKSPEAEAKPLLLLHGWPSSPLEFLKVIGPLSNPVAHGGRAEDAFDLVIPSVPGFAFSGPTTEAGWHPGRIADAFAELMTGLGYDTFFAHGGDFGSVLAGQLSVRHPDRVAGLHVTFLVTGGLRPEDGDPTAEEAQLAADQAVYNMVETGYLALQATKPQTIAYSLVDSPVGLAAWIVEKLNTWTDNGGVLESVLSKDEILANIMTYWVTATGGSSGRLYFETGAAGMMGPSSERVESPVAVAIFPHELYRATRRVAEHHYNVVRWTPQAKGGHFPALEQPQLLATDIRESLRAMSGVPAERSVG